MQLEDYFDFLAPDDIRIKGHRIGIETVLYEYIYHAQTPEEIQLSYPTLSLEEVYATITYYWRNKDQIDAYLTKWLEWSHRMRVEQAQHPDAFTLKLRQARAERELAEKRAKYEAS
jgi:uncharacterized protein (DUF433 family)